MANRQTFPASLFPLRGDVSAEAGDTTATVTGIQTTPFSATTPTTGQIPVMGADGVWHPEDPAVSGVDAVGSTPSKPPVQVGGIDEGNLVRELRTDTSGSIRAYTMEDLLQMILLELRAVKAAIVSLDNTANIADFAPDNFTDSDQQGMI